MSESQVFQVERRVEFCETDAAGIAHFSAFLCYMEQAEHAFWRHLGTSVMPSTRSGERYSWPRVHVECDFRGAATFEDVLQISLRLLKLGNKSLTFGFNFRRERELIATGSITTVCCEVRPGAALKSIAIPEPLRAQLRAYLAEESLPS